MQKAVLAVAATAFFTVPLAIAQRTAGVPHKPPAPEKSAQQSTSEVIDGAKTPDLIPDDQAYHLVLMVASAADDAPEVETKRAKAVRAMILRFGGLPGDDVPALAEVANHHRKTLTTLAAEAKRGNADAERLKSEHLGRVKAEAELRLPAATRKALADYVKAEKANMKIHGKPDPVVVAMPELLKTGFTALGYCDNDAGSLAPYCSDGCSGSRPCDKKCRRSDESCTTCGDYGVCCCLGGGGDPPPPPPPTPPPGGMSGEPSGATYTNTSVSGATFYATAITDSAASCSCHSSRAIARIFAPWGQSSNSSGVVGAYAQTTASYVMREAEFDTEAAIDASGEHYSYCPIRTTVFIDTTTLRPSSSVFFKALFKKDRHDDTINKWVYVRDYCTGQCQPPKWCSTQECNWLAIEGFRVSLGFGFIRCEPIPPFPRCSSTRPQCKQVFGGVIWGGDFECKAEE